MELLFSEEFRKDFRKIKDKPTRIRIIKQIRKLAMLPESGKPLQYDLKKYRSIKISPFRLIYRLEKDRTILN